MRHSDFVPFFNELWKWNDNMTVFRSITHYERRLIFRRRINRHKSMFIDVISHLIMFYHLFLIIAHSFFVKILHLRNISLIRVLILFMTMWFYSFKTVFVSTFFSDVNEVCGENIFDVLKKYKNFDEMKSTWRSSRWKLIYVE